MVICPNAIAFAQNQLLRPFCGCRSGGLSLAVLHPRKFAVYSCVSQGAAYMQTTRLYEHWLEHTAANLTYGPFGGSSKRASLSCICCDTLHRIMRHLKHQSRSNIITRSNVLRMRTAPAPDVSPLACTVCACMRPLTLHHTLYVLANNEITPAHLRSLQVWTMCACSHMTANYHSLRQRHSRSPGTHVIQLLARTVTRLLH